MIGEWKVLAERTEANVTIGKVERTECQRNGHQWHQSASPKQGSENASQQLLKSRIISPWSPCLIHSNSEKLYFLSISIINISDAQENLSAAILDLTFTHSHLWLHLKIMTSFLFCLNLYCNCPLLADSDLCRGGRGSFEIWLFLQCKLNPRRVPQCYWTENNKHTYFPES